MEEEEGKATPKGMEEEEEETMVELVQCIIAGMRISDD